MNALCWPAAASACAALAAWALTGLSGDDVARVASGFGDLVRAILCVARARMPPRGRRRRDVGLSEVSEMVDIVRLGMSAGLSFDAALGLYCAGRDGALATSLGRAMLLWQTGVEPRSEALAAVAGEFGMPSLRSFGAQVSQSLAFGAPVAAVLAELARETRELHRAEVERRIERAPVKILVPTGTLVLPALLLSILGPLLAAGGVL